MSVSLSTHLLEQHYAFHQSRAPFGQPVRASELAICGPMSYAQQMHGFFPAQQSFMDQSMASTSMDGSTFQTMADISEATAQKIATLQAKLNKKLGPEYISQRAGPGGAMKLTYAEGWKIINLANEVFGFNGWSSSIVNLNTDFVDYTEDTRRYNVGVSAVIRITLRDGVYHEDVGYGMLENSKSKGAALDKCKKEAVTDGIKRALRNFGNLLGNCLYDKQYTQEIVKMKVPPAKFDKSELHRRPEFQEGSSTTSHVNAISKPAVPLVIPKAIGLNPYSANPTSNSSVPVGSTNKPSNAIPGHVRPAATSTPIRNNVPQRIASGERETVSTDASIPRGQNYGGVVSSITNPPQAYQMNIPQTLKPLVPKAPPSHAHQVNLRVYGPNTSPKPCAQQKLEPAESYSFDSDEDGFLAALELAEGDSVYNDLIADIGRPISDSEGIGSAIDFDEGTRGPEQDDSGISSSDQKTLVEGISRDKKSLPLKEYPKNIWANTKSMSSNCVPAQNFPKPQPAQVGPPVQYKTLQPRVSPTSNVPPAVSPEDDELAKQVVALRRAKSATRKQSLPPPGRSVDENALPKVVQSNPQPVNTPRTPSMGGFNFPPGIKIGAPLASTVRPGQPVNVSAGIKRPAEALNTGQFSSKGAGVPFSYADAQARSTRQPFAPLDISEEGIDLKRARR